MNRDEFFMSRALDLAIKGRGFVSPNPMVGAVIVAPNNRIIGEGWHRCYGKSHAEVNAVKSVADAHRHLLPQSEIYVTLEPCSHYGKTPPCALLLIKENFKRVVVGCIDSFSKVSGSGIRMIREAGIEVCVGVLEKECKALNRVFFTAHTLHRPFITLKWAQSDDGWMDSNSRHPYRFSTPLSQCLVHRLRADNDAILTSSRTVNSDDPQLDIRFWNHQRMPKPIVISRNTPIEQTKRILKRADLINLTMTNKSLPEIMTFLYKEHGITSLLVEGGTKLLNSFIENRLWDSARVEVNPVILGNDGCIKAPSVPCVPSSVQHIGDNTVYIYNRN